MLGAGDDLQENASIVHEIGTHEVFLAGVYSDASNDALTVTAASSDENKATVSMASDGSSLTVTAHARGTSTITVTADDGNGGTVEDTFTVTVKAAPVVASALAVKDGVKLGHMVSTLGDYVRLSVKGKCPPSRLPY